MPPRKKRILVVLPSPLMARNFLRGDTLRLICSEVLADTTVVTPNPADRELIEKQGAQWHPYYHPRRYIEIDTPTGIRNLVRFSRYARYLAGLFVHMCLTYRFNSRAGFEGFASRLRQSFHLRKAYLREGLPMSRVFGFPFSQSPTIYQWLHRLYFQRWQTFSPVEALIEKIKPDLMVLSMMQTHMVTPYAVAAGIANVKMLGINGSWDQPTTKGPLCPGLASVVVQNEIVRMELVRYHGVPNEIIKTIGWLQMDAYFGVADTGREALCSRIGVPIEHRYILFAANAPRLGKHEPAVFMQLVRHVQSDVLGRDVTLILRCHPQDRDWRARWGWAMSLPRVVVEPPDLGPLDHLAMLLRHAGVVIASAGSINLDAVAVDTPTIGLAWEDMMLPYEDRPARAYDLEHLKTLRESSGMMFARNLGELFAACKRYLQTREVDAAGRKTLREQYLFRLDGLAASRLTREIQVMLQ